MKSEFESVHEGLTRLETKLRELEGGQCRRSPEQEDEQIEQTVQPPESVSEVVYQASPDIRPPPIARNHVLLSGRFVKEERVAYMQEVNTCLEQLGIRTFKVEAAAGQDFGQMTAEGLKGARVMVAFCTSSYGEKTGAGYETYEELKYVHEHRGECILIPVKLHTTYPPQPPGSEGQSLCSLAFSQAAVYINGLAMNDKGEQQFQAPEWVAEQVKECLKRQNLLDQVQFRSQPSEQRMDSKSKSEDSGEF